MNYKLPALSLLGLTAFFSLAAIHQPPALAQRTSFYCDSSKSPPTTYIKSRGRKSAVIRWNLGLNRRSAIERCRIVSQRFQRQHDSGNLRFFKTGYLNGYPVVCAARTSGDRCTNRMLLFTLTRGSDPDTVLQKLFNVNSLATSTVVNQSGRSEVTTPDGVHSPPKPEVDNESTYSFDNYITDLPNEENPTDEPTLDSK